MQEPGEPTFLRNRDDPPPRRADGRRVAASFQRSLGSLWPEVRSSIDAQRTYQHSIFFTGHSHGAALAILAAAYLRANDQVIHGVYTFGQPRVGDRAFADWLQADFGSHIFRFVNNNDVVTLVPLRKAGYRHSGTLVYFNEAGELHSDRHWWFRLLDRLEDQDRGSFDQLLDVAPNGIRDHSIDRYKELTDRHRVHGLRP